MKRILYRSFSVARGDRLALRLSAHSLRILTYHGVCEDQVAYEPWVPPCFVSLSSFERQVAYLKRHTNVLSLSEAVERLKRRDLPERSVAITFDDGYANNLHVAYPVLEKYGLPATIFLITAYSESGELFPFDRHRVPPLQENPAQHDRMGGQDLWLEGKQAPLALVLDRVNSCYGDAGGRLPENVREALRPLRAEELKKWTSRLVEFGAHTHRHAILRNESLARREWEISTSIDRVREWTGQPVKLFSYPNGELGDFGELDKQMLRSEGIEAAVTAIPGINRAGCDLFGLRRYSVSLYHDWDAFLAELSGFRTVVNSLAGRRASGSSASQPA